jgi:hypothetical protein
MRTPQFTFEDVLKSFTFKKVLSKAELLQACGCSSMTAWRRLHKEGYFTSYNYNAKYYTLAGIPQFDDHGLWAYRDIRFSRWGTLPKTMVALIECSSGGMTARELEELLHVRNVKPLLTQLTLKQRLWREALGGAFVYLAVEQRQHDQQLQRRLAEGALQPPPLPLPEPQQIIALLVEMIRHPQQTPRQWARRLGRRNIRLGAEDIRAVLQHYQLMVKKGLLSS